MARIPLIAPEAASPAVAANGDDRPHEPGLADVEAGERDSDGERRRRRRGRRGGRWRNRDGTPGENGAREPRVELAAEVAEGLVEAAIESAEMPAAEASHQEPPRPTIEPELPAVDVSVEEPPPVLAEPEFADAEAIVEAAIESAEIPAAEPEPVLELETVGAPPKRVRASRAKSAPRPEPAPIDVRAVTDKPETPRRGWWQRLTQP